MSNNNYSQFRTITEGQFRKRYGDGKQIDSGTYGIVRRHKVKEENSEHKEVAIKKLYTKEGIDGFCQETSIMSKVDHENVIQCLDYFKIAIDSEDDPIFEFYYVMPFCEKGNLKTCLQKIKSWEQTKKVKLCYQIAKGVNALHEEELMHRDLKPENILLDSQYKVKLCDFGFSKKDEENETQKTAKVGTPLYRAPNVATGKYTKKCDIYSAGLTFDTIFRGDKIFKARNMEELSREQQESKKIQEKVNSLACAQKMKKIIVSCIKLKEQERPSSEVVMKMLEQLLMQLDPQFCKKIHDSEQARKKQIKLFAENRLLKVNEEIEKQKEVERRQQQEQKRKQEEKIKIERKREEEQKEKEQQMRIQRERQEKDKKLKEESERKQQQLKELRAREQLETVNLKDLEMKKSNTATQLLQAEEIKLSRPHVFSERQIQTQPFKPTKIKHGSNIFNKLIRIRANVLRNEVKNQNFESIFSFFENKRKCIQKIDEVSAIKSYTYTYRKLVIFVALFGYFRFILVHQDFMKNENKMKVIHDIQNIKYENICELTKQKCKELLKNENTIIRQTLNKYLQDVRSQRALYKPYLSDYVNQMLNEGEEKTFATIDRFSSKLITEQFKKLVFHDNFASKDDEPLKISIFEVHNTF